MKTTLTRSFLAIATATAMCAVSPALAQETQDVTVTANLIDNTTATSFEVVDNPDFGDLVKPDTNFCQYLLSASGLRLSTNGGDAICAVTDDFTIGKVRVNCTPGAQINLSGGTSGDGFAVNIIASDPAGDPAQQILCETDGETDVPFLVNLTIQPSAPNGALNVAVPVDFFTE